MTDFRARYPWSSAAKRTQTNPPRVFFRTTGTETAVGSWVSKFVVFRCSSSWRSGSVPTEATTPRHNPIFVILTRSLNNRRFWRYYFNIEPRPLPLRSRTPSCLAPRQVRRRRTRLVPLGGPPWSRYRLNHEQQLWSLCVGTSNGLSRCADILDSRVASNLEGRRNEFAMAFVLHHMV